MLSSWDRFAVYFPSHLGRYRADIGSLYLLVKALATCTSFH